jgi:tRNA A37 N6-isopentenylltransferase MiaA
MNFCRVAISPSQASNLPSRHFLSSKSGQSPTSTDLHSLYLEQINDIQAEREAVFGPSDPASDSHDISHVAKAYSTEEQSRTQSIQSTAESSARLPPDWDAEQAYAERDALFQFTAQEKSAWTNHSSISKQSSRMMQMELIKEVIAQDERLKQANTNNHETQSSSQLFSHLNPKGDGISMVDVGHKTSTRRIAKARSVVFFPQEVMSALVRRGEDMIGPKGPIFETARIAGMMGAK